MGSAARVVWQVTDFAGEVLHQSAHPTIVLFKIALPELEHVGLLVDAHAGRNRPGEPA